MKQFLYKAFNVEQSEGLSVFLLILQSFFLGIFYGSFDITASALFLESFPTAMLPKAFVISGIAGILLTGIYTQLQSRISFARLAWINLFVITFITILLRVGFYYTDVKWLPFSILVMLGPLNILAMLSFWGVASRVFTLRQGKRLFGLIDSGQVFGVIVSSYAIPVILLLNFSTRNLLYVCSVSILLALIVQIIISGKFPFKASDDKQKEAHQKSINIRNILKNKFVVYMSLFVSLSMISAFFIYYSFLSVTNIKYPDSKELAKFLGLFTGTVMIFSFIFKTFVYSKIMQTYNLRISLLILPTLLFLLSVLAIIVGTAFGYSAETAGFILFFLLIALSRLFSLSLKQSIEAPSFKILYLSLNKNIRYDIQARIDGVVNEFAALFSGLTLAALGIISFIKPIHYTYILIAVLIVWFLVTLKLYREYQASLIKSLTGDAKQNGNEVKYSNNPKSLLDNRKNGNPDLMMNKLLLAEIVEPVFFENCLPDFLIHESPNVRKYILKKIEDDLFLAAVPALETYILNEKNQENIKLASSIKEKFQKKTNINFSKEYITSLIKSKHPEEREFAAKIIGLLHEEAYYPYLVALLRDLDFRVRSATIKSCASARFSELCPLLIEYLSDYQYMNYATEALVAIGYDALDILELSFYKSDLDTKIQARIIKIFGLISNEKAISYLINKLDFPVREVVKRAIIALTQRKYKYNTQHYIYIRPAIDLTISIIAWDLAAINNSKNDEINHNLREALQAELKENYDLLYLLLSLIYDPVLISTVKDNIENGSGEGVSYALELFDLYVADDLKPILFPLFENTSVAEKVSRLQDFYPLEKQDALTLINSIITRDSNYINRWTKACAIYNLRNFKNQKANIDLLAHLFNPDKLLFETASFIVRLIDPEAFNNCGKRIATELKNDMDYRLILVTEKKTHLLFEKILFLKSLKLFESLPDAVLSEIAEYIEEVNIDAGQTILSKNNKNKASLFFIVKGNVCLMNHKKNLFEFSNNSFITEYMLLDSFLESANFTVTEPSALYFINNKNLLCLIKNYEEILMLLLKSGELVK